MQKLKAILTLIRFPNLVFIFLTQLLTYYYVIAPSISSPSLSNPYVLLLCFSTLLIAAAGYIINDYFDMGIDLINKPQKITIEKDFSRRKIIIWHILLNALGIFIASYIAFHFGKLRFVTVQLLCVFLLLVYSTTFKRKLISGNLIIAILTPLTLYCMALYEPQFKLYDTSNSLSITIWIYIVFAFLITFIREIIKDTEDIKGDLAQQCKTIPLVWGINTAKNIVFVLIILLWVVILLTSYFLFQKNIFLLVVLILGVFLPLIATFYLLKKANTSKQFHKISFYIKLITLAGILSMLFI